MTRHQLPVYSPLPAAAIRDGFRAVLRDDGKARHQVRAYLEKIYEPSSILLTDSGTSALSLALRAVARERSDAPVALPAYSCFDIATAADGASVSCLLYDLEPRTLGPDLESLKACLEAGACALVIAHLYGMPVELEPVRALARETGAVLIEDAAQAAGATYRGRPVGSIGSLSLLSFGRGKGLTGGGGGALLAFDELGDRLIEVARERLRGRGPGWSSALQSVGQWTLGHPSRYFVAVSLPFLHLGETVYREPDVPRGMSRFSAGVLSVTMLDYGSEVRRRRSRAARFIDWMDDSESLSRMRWPADSEPTFLRLPALVEESRRLDARCSEARRLGVMPGYPRVLDRLEPFRYRVRNLGQGFPGAEELTSRLVTLPVHSLLSERDEKRLAEWIGAGRDGEAVG